MSNRIKGDGSSLANSSSYKRLIGRLIYLTNTDPDICFVVHHLNQFLANPLHSHYQVALRTLRYIKGAFVVGLFFPVDFDLHLKAFSDSNWASWPNTRHCTTSFCIYFRNSLISWKSKKQNTILCSS